jgi:hypothetical protein
MISMDKEAPQNLNRTVHRSLISDKEARSRSYRSLLSLHTSRPAKEGGQSVIIIAVAFIGLLAFIGLAVDFGILLIGMGHLKRSVDAAALAAATQYRDGIDTPQISLSANEFLRLNGVDLDNISSKVETCATATIPNDPALCTNPPRKLVRITASADVSFVFLPILGIDSFTISASSIAEAASMDVVLAIDISESMTYGMGSISLDPSVCNQHDQCEPFHDIKAAARQFADKVLNQPAAEEGNRLAVVIFSDGWEADKYGTQVIDPCGAFYNGGGCPPGPGQPGYDPTTYAAAHSGWMTDYHQADTVINKLEVITPPKCDDPGFAGKPGLCRNMDASGNFIGMSCPWSFPIAAGGLNDYSTCTTTNIGGGLEKAGGMFDQGRRTDALWIVIVLTDGAANATKLKGTDDLGAVPGIPGPGKPVSLAEAKVNQPGPGDDAALESILPVGYCPEHQFGQFPSCRDTSTSRHTPTTDPQYDADDYARDQADFVGCLGISPAAACHGEHGQGALIFSIGVGDQVLTRSASDPNYAYGDNLLRYIAAVGDDGDPATDPCAGPPVVSVPTLPLAPSYIGYQCGNYYFRRSGGQLSAVFTDIYNHIYTRITQ